MNQFHISFMILAVTSDRECFDDVLKKYKRAFSKAGFEYIISKNIRHLVWECGTRHTRVDCRVWYKRGQKNELINLINSVRGAVPLTMNSKKPI